MSGAAGMSIEHTGLDVHTEPWWLGPQLRMVLTDDRPLAEVDTADGAVDSAGGGPAGQDPVQVLDCYARQVDELAALVEDALAEEDTDYQAQVATLRVRHQQRVTSLQVLAESLGETHGALDELAHQLRGTTPSGVAPGAPSVARPGTSAPARPVATVSPLVRGGR